MRSYDLLVRFYALSIVIVLALLVALLCHCAESQKIPSWPRPPVVQACKLPPGPTLPVVSRTEDGCPTDMVCFNVKNAAKLLVRERRMKAWIKEVKLRCGRSDAGVVDAGLAE